MTQPGMDPLVALLTVIAQSEPQPWYPRAYTESRGMASGALDSPLERLRMLGLIELTEWVANTGQGYRLTTAGKKVLYNPGLQSKLASGTLQPAAPEPEGSPEGDWRDPNRGANAYERGEIIRRSLTGNARPVITYILIGLNLAVFLYGLYLASQRPGGLGGGLLMGGSPSIAIRSGALTPNSLVDGEWWRLLTSCFVHFGVIHLGVNMYSLWVLGPLSEKAWGRWRFLALYMISGIGGSSAMAFSMATGLEPAGAGAGASGALWGIIVGFGVWVWLNRQSLGQALSSTWLRQIITCLVINTILTFMITILSKSGHFGGGVFGLVTAVLLNEQRFAGGMRRLLATVGVVAVPVLAVAAAAYVQPKDRVPLHVNEEAFDGILAIGMEANNHAKDTYESSIEPVQEKPWDKRLPGDVKSARDALDKERHNLREAADLLEQVAAPNQQLEAQRTTLIACLRARGDLFEHIDLQLQKGEDWTQDDEKAMKAKKTALNEAIKRCQAALGG